MLTHTLPRSAAGDDRTPERPPVRRSPVGRLRAFARWMGDRCGTTGRDSRLDVYPVLQEARGMIEQGWVQDRWFARRTPPALRPTVGRRSEGPDGVAAACLVGAVRLAVRRRGATDDLMAAGPALDALWDAWQESRGYGGAGVVSGRAAPREVRAVRAHDLIRWNDQPGRTRGEVLDLVDRATSRTIIAAMCPDPDGPVTRRRTAVT